MVSIDVHLGRKFTIQRGERKIDTDSGVDSFNVLNHINFTTYIYRWSPLFERPTRL